MSRLRDMASHRSVESVSDERKEKNPDAQKTTDKIAIWRCATNKNEKLFITCNVMNVYQMRMVWVRW